MKRIVPISAVKTRLPEFVTGVEEREDEVVVTRHGRPSAVLLSYAKYEGLKATLDVLSDANLLRQIRCSRQFFGSGRKGLSFEEVFREPIRPVRKREIARVVAAESKGGLHSRLERLEREGAIVRSRESLDSLRPVLRRPGAVRRFLASRD